MLLWSTIFTDPVEEPEKRWRFIYDLHVQCFKAEIKRKQAVVGEEDGEIITAFSIHDPGRKQAGFSEYLATGIGMVFHYGITPFKWFDMYDKCVAPADRFIKENPDVAYTEVFLKARADGIGTRDIQEYMVPYVKKRAEACCL